MGIIFAWDEWENPKDSYAGHPHSVDNMLKIDEDTLISGSSDGLLRLVQIHPNKFLGLLGDHDDFPVEDIQFSHDKRLLGSLSYDNSIRLWDSSILLDEDDNEEDDNVDDTVDLAARSTHLSDDEWDSSSSSSCSSDCDSSTMKKRKKLKTRNEIFFADL